ncbi:helix-turn-helix transcriptional regulator [Kribbella solani]|uniref:helix-turn-helix transcriptional regulator n=1 Tax=Kribbella solani TaxID=236067 RepID=UPI0029B8FF52|nr:AraC family transcriptional regulator [Kribbella solani]MDX2967623.1 AraC family transcriptional regulator [Kribbella solani]
MSGRATVRAWRPGVAGVVEVLHAHFPSHTYPSHTHDAWTVLIVDEGAVRYDLDHREHGLAQAQVSLLPPHVPHDGRSVRPEGFRKRVLYLAPERLGDNLIGAAVDQPEYVDPLLRHRIHQLHGVLENGQDDLEAQSRLTLIEERLGQHLRRDVIAPPDRCDAGVAVRLRELLDAHVTEGITLEAASRLVHAHPAHLVRAFSREYGLPPHRYLTGRRVDLARRYLLDGHPAAEVASLAGFYDQSHLNRHFRKLLGVTPSTFVKR